MTKRNLEAQKKATAIKNILKGENLSRQKFKDFWNDKECFSLSAAINPYIIERDHYQGKFTSWRKEWRWDEEFVTNLFLAMLEKHTNYYHSIFPSDLLAHLPDSVTNDIHFARLASRRYINLYQNYMGDFVENLNEFPWEPQDRNNSVLDRWIVNAYKEKHFEIEITPQFEYLVANPEYTLQAIENGTLDLANVPYALRRTNKKIAAAVIRHHRDFWGIPKAYLDDIPFAIDCLGDTPDNILSDDLERHLSYRIRKLVRYDEENKSCLKSLLSYFHLAETVPEKTHVESSTKPTARVNKI